MWAGTGEPVFTPQGCRDFLPTTETTCLGRLFGSTMLSHIHGNKASRRKLLEVQEHPVVCTATSCSTRGWDWEKSCSVTAQSDPCLPQDVCAVQQFVQAASPGQQRPRVGAAPPLAGVLEAEQQSPAQALPLGLVQGAQLEAAQQQRRECAERESLGHLNRQVRAKMPPRVSKQVLCEASELLGQQIEFGGTHGNKGQRQHPVVGRGSSPAELSWAGLGWAELHWRHMAVLVLAACCLQHPLMVDKCSKPSANGGQQVWVQSRAVILVLGRAQTSCQVMGLPWHRRGCRREEGEDRTRLTGSWQGMREENSAE